MPSRTAGENYREKTLSQKINVCNVCGSANDNLVAHHIDGNRENNDLDNLIPLCKSCHRKVHSHKPYNKVLDRLTDQLEDLPFIRNDEYHWSNRDKNL